MKVLNVTGKLPMHLTNLYYYLPHLREYEDAIIPNIVIGQQRTGGRKYSLVRILHIHFVRSLH